MSKPEFIGRSGEAPIFLMEDGSLLVLNRKTRRQIASRDRRSEAGIASRREKRAELREWANARVLETQGA
jgi:hypothetical protein